MAIGDVPSPRLRLPRAERSLQLLTVAEEVFAERGIRAAAMDEIADRAGVTKPVLYDHFGSKDGLLAAVIARAGADLRTAIQATVTGADTAEEALLRGFTAYFEFIDQHRAAWSRLLSETGDNSAAAGALEDVRHDIGGFIADLIVAEVPTTDRARALVYAQAVIGACERLATTPTPGTRSTPEALASHLMDVIWTGFAALRSPA